LILFAYGGWYFDTDIEFFKSLSKIEQKFDSMIIWEPTDRLVEQGWREGLPRPLVMIAAMGSMRPRSELMSTFAMVVANNAHYALSRHSAVDVTGPRVAARILHAFKQTDFFRNNVTLFQAEATSSYILNQPSRESDGLVFCEFLTPSTPQEQLQAEYMIKSYFAHNSTNSWVGRTTQYIPDKCKWIGEVVPKIVNVVELLRPLTVSS
jgi:hypothetical protein